MVTPAREVSRLTGMVSRRPLTRSALYAFVAAGAAVACTVYGLPTPDSAVAVEGQVPRAASEVAPIETLGPIPVTSGTGPRIADAPPSLAVLPDGVISNGVFPQIYAPTLREQESVAVRVVDLAVAAAGLTTGQVWSGRLREGFAELDVRLQQGAGYGVEVQNSAGLWREVGSIAVAGSSEPEAPLAQTGGIAVNQVTGNAAWSWQAPSLPGPIGELSVGLAWSGAERSSAPGLPRGWRYTVSTGSPWMRLLTSDTRTSVAAAPTSTTVTRTDDDSVRVSYGTSQTLGDVSGFVVRERSDAGGWRPAGSTQKSGSVTIDGADDTSRVQVGTRVEGTVVWGPVIEVPDTAGDSETVRTPLRSGTPLPAVVRVVGWDGTTLVFARNGLGGYEQVSASRRTPGFAMQLSASGPGWTLTDSGGVMTRFDGGRVSAVIVDGREVATVEWASDGRIESVANEVGREFRFVYAGEKECPSAAWTQYGFAAPARGDLCRIQGPGDTDASIGYQVVGDERQIALVTEPGNLGTALGWDTRGRLVAERASLVAQVATVDPAVRSALATLVNKVAYDSKGRASALTEQPAAPGQSGITSVLTFPAVTSAALRDAASSPASDPEAGAVTATLTQRGSFPFKLTTLMDPITLSVVRQTDAAGLTTSLPDTDGRVKRMRDIAGMVTTSETDSLGMPIRSSGPTVPGGRGLVTEATYDTRFVNGEDKALVGLRTIEYTARGFTGLSSDEFWPADPTRGAFSRTWRGERAEWSGQAQGVWIPSDTAEEAANGTWTFEVKASDRTRMRMLLNGVPCIPDQRERCTFERIPRGPKNVAVEISAATSDGWFEVQVGAGTETPRAFAADSVRPGYGLTTVNRSNDAYGRVSNPAKRTAFADPASRRPVSSTSPGGLTTSFSYESDGWQRLILRTTPGGESVRSTYWPDDARVDLPELCGGTTVVSGQRRAVTRQDGTSLTSYPDLTGRTVAQEVRGASGAVGETVCMAYAADGTLRSQRIFNADGELVESTVIAAAVGGDPRVRRTTILKGPGALVGEGARDVTTVRMDLRGNVLERLDGSGVRRTTTYNVLGLPTRLVVDPPVGATVTFEYTYRAVDGQLQQVSVNDVVAASITYDRVARPQTYSLAGGAVRMTLTRSDSGQPVRMAATVGQDEWLSVLETTPAGRATGSRMSGPSFSTEQAYRYDTAGRLARATIDVTRGQSTTQTVYDYGFGPAAQSCDSYRDAGADALRTSGSRGGIDYVSCYRQGRLVSTTDPLLVGGASGPARFAYDSLGRVTAVQGVERPLALQWDAGGAVARVTEGTSQQVVTELTTFGGIVRDQLVTSTAGTSRARAGGGIFWFDLDDAGQVSGLDRTQYSLPGGAIVTIPAGGTATVQVPSIEGTTLTTVAVPALGAGAPAEGIGPGAVFGPYGERLEAATTAPDSATPEFAWRTAPAAQTLRGTSSISILGARAYLPATGTFLSPDPIVDAGLNMYSYTSGDPVNYEDGPGTEESPTYLTPVGIFGGAVLSFLSGFFARGWLRVGLAVATAVGASAAVAIGSGATTDSPGGIALAVGLGVLVTGAGALSGAVVRVLSSGGSSSLTRSAISSRLSQTGKATRAPRRATVGGEGFAPVPTAARASRSSTRSSLSWADEVADTVMPLERNFGPAGVKATIFEFEVAQRAAQTANASASQLRRLKPISSNSQSMKAGFPFGGA